MKKVFVILVAFLFVFSACEEQDVLQIEEETVQDIPNVKLESFTMEEVPTLVNSISQTTKSAKINWTSRSEGEGIILDESRILAVTDSIGNLTYSVRMFVPDTPYNVFYNLVSKQTADGIQNDPMVLRYEVAEEYWETYKTSSREEAPFKGIVSVYSLNQLANVEFVSNRSEITAEPCLDYQVGDSSSNQGGSSPGGNAGGNHPDLGTDHDPGSYTSYYVYYAPSYGGGVGSGTQPFVEIGEGSFGDFGTEGDLKRALSGKEKDCPEDELLIPVNEVEEAPPSCESFKFQKLGNNQFSYVKGIRFLVIDGDGEKHYLRYDNPMEFSTPYEDRFGVVYEPGALAESSAKALKEAMDNTKDYILDSVTYIGEYQAKRYFEDQLKRLYPLYIPGGRVQPRPNNQHVSTVTEYKAEWFGTGNCD